MLPLACIPEETSLPVNISTITPPDFYHLPPPHSVILGISKLQQSQPQHMINSIYMPIPCCVFHESRTTQSLEAELQYPQFTITVPILTFSECFFIDRLVHGTNEQR